MSASVSNMVLMVVLMGCIAIVVADISGTNPPASSCLCTTASNVTLRNAACGDVVDVVDVDVCFVYTGARYLCSIGPEEFEYFQVAYSGHQRWTTGEKLKRSGGRSCGADVNELQVIIIGDYGQLFLGQESVADAMGNWSALNWPAWIQSTGDNIYPNGLRSWDDPQVDTKWRNIYVQDTIKDLVWHQCLGNHDFGNDNGEEWNQVELTEHEPRWYQPHLWYDWVEDVGDHSVHFVVIDTESFRKQINNYTDMVDWMEATLSQSTADWKLVIGHRTVFSVGDHGPFTDELLYELVPIMERHGVAAYICGHDHNLQHIRNITATTADMDYVISGSGGAGLYPYRQENADYLLENFNMYAPFFQFSYGFVTLTTSATQLIFDYYHRDQYFLYQFVKQR